MKLKLPKNKIANIFKNKISFMLIGVLILVIIGGFVAYNKFIAKPAISQTQPIEEIDLIFDPEGPYAILTPRRDGNALILNIKRTASYDAISYELAYVSQAEGSSASAGEGIDRGVMGKIEVKDKKSEYEQEILFGTCSKNVCKYDKGVENGTLVLHIKKGSEAYKMVTQWHLQQPQVALGKLNSGDGHFNYLINTKSADLGIIKYTIINDLSGAPKLPTDKTVIGKVYALKSVNAQSVPAGEITIELVENPTAESKIYRFDETSNKWVELATKISGSKLTAESPNGGIFAVLTPSK